MKKLLQFLDNNILKICISFLLVFTVLYPKLPSIKIPHVWVYIRLEDFFIALTVGIWLLQFLRRKVKIPWPISFPILLYWVAGFLSLVFSLIFLAPHLANFFPQVAALSYFRRIEYMVLFFAAFSTVKSPKDIKDYLLFIGIAVGGACLYGFGQRYYINLWAAFPDFFRHYQFCFPSFQTGNEEFAKGIPLCLPSDARITSTFGGHYDLAAYLVIVLPIFITFMTTVKKWAGRIVLGVLSIAGLILLILTASRVSYIAFLIGAVFALVYAKKKWLIGPVVIISIILLMVFSQSTAKRFLETLRLTSVVTNSQGQVVGEAESNLPADLKNKIAKNPVVEGNEVTQNLPAGSLVLGLPQLKSPNATNTAVVRTSLNSSEAKRLNLDNGGIEISTISGNFLVHKALVYDISFTTRLQGEWPNAVNAFLRNPLLGSGYATITLASDNDYLRLLGESGAFGFFSFALIFIFLGIVLKEAGPDIKSAPTKAFLYGLAGGVIGLFFNASLIDVFEASKVAENLWMLLGIATGAVFIYTTEKKIPYLKNLKQIFSSNLLNGIYLLIGTLAVFAGSVGNFLVADDFTWLHWAASSTVIDLRNNFINASGFFYRPIDKLVVFFLNTLFALTPIGYHMFGLLLHYLLVVGIYLFVLRITEKKSIAISSAILFLLLPVHGENLYWFATVSTNLSTFFMFFALYCFYKTRKSGSVFSYIASIALFMLALFSYEMSVIFPLLLVALDLTITRAKMSTKRILTYLPFVILVPLYLHIRNAAHAVAGGGDYSYSLTHLIPNFVGNLFGYLGMYLFGEHAIPLYAALRAGTRTQSVIFSVISVVIILVVGFLIVKYRKHLRKFDGTMEGKVVLFGILMSIISLLPFIGLGNISERYGYLSSIGFCIAAAVLLSMAVSRFAQKKRVGIVLAVVLAVISVLFFLQLKAEDSEWARAGIITHRTLSVFRLDYDSIPMGSTIYFVNVPVRKDNAWIFPYTSIKDGMWFVYRDNTQKIYQVGSVDEAKNLEESAEAGMVDIQEKKDHKFYIFTFDKDGNLTEVKGMNQ